MVVDLGKLENVSFKTSLRPTEQCVDKLMQQGEEDIIKLLKGEKVKAIEIIWVNEFIIN